MNCAQNGCGLWQGKVSIMTTIETPAVTPAPKTTLVLGKFKGAFGNFQAAAFTDLKAAGFEPLTAHLIADDYGADIGNAMRAGDDFGTKIAKAKKDGDSRISISGRGSVTMSNTMALLRVCQVTSGLVKEKLLKSHKVSRESLSDEVQSYIARVEKRHEQFTVAEA